MDNNIKKLESLKPDTIKSIPDNEAISLLTRLIDQRKNEIRVLHKAYTDSEKKFVSLLERKEQLQSELEVLKDILSELKEKYND